MMALTSADPFVREGTWADIPAMVAIEQASFADPWTPDAFISALELDRMLVLVAEERGSTAGTGVPTLVGYVLALLVGDEAEIADLAVAPAVRRRGIGRTLLDRLLADIEARGARTVYLEVRESNEAARTLYESRRFRAVGRRRGYYRHPPEDALLLKREMAPG